MARAAVAVAAAALLFLAVAFANPSELPPVDQDGSGDDDDSSSGSGFDGLLEEEFVHGVNANNPTEVSLTTLQSPTENQHPMVEKPEGPEEKDAGTTSTVVSTAAVQTEKLIPDPGQPEPEEDVPAKETVTNPGSAVFVPTTTLPTDQLETVKMDVALGVSPEVPNIPQEQTTPSVVHAADPIVDLFHQGDVGTTEAVEPHTPHHHHHHHHHHTTAASVTEAVDTHLHHVPHHVTEAVDTHLHHVPHHGTSTPNATQGSDFNPAIQEDTSPTSTGEPLVHRSHDGEPLVHHSHDANQVTESYVDAHPTTRDASLLEEDSASDAKTTRASYDEERKTNVPIILFDPESEAERTDSPEFDGSGASVDGNDFVFEPSIPRSHVPDDKIAVQDDGMSDTSKGILEQKGVLAAVIAGGLAGLVFAICLVGFMLYRMKKKDEGSYCLEETKQTNGGYEKPIKQEEFYA